MFLKCFTVIETYNFSSKMREKKWKNIEKVQQKQLIKMKNCKLFMVKFGFYICDLFKVLYIHCWNVVFGMRVWNGKFDKYFNLISKEFYFEKMLLKCFIASLWKKGSVKNVDKPHKKMSIFKWNGKN